ncbi:MAG: multidrug efflux SMR transporter [Lysobacteraceae bacterium]|nr:multidrug efflux SMR transporter [Xanthomonadales bacterium]
MPWIYLGLAGLLEVAWAIGLKYSDGFSLPWPSLWTLLTMAASFWLLALALRSLPIGTAYAIWTGIGAVGTVVLGILLFGESASWPRLFCIVLILAGIAGLKITTPAADAATGDRPGISSPG